MKNTYDAGNNILLTVQFTDINGAAIDPTTVTLMVQDPAGVQTTYSGGVLTHTGTGAYSYPVYAFKAGVWHYRWEGAGAVVAADDNTFVVNPTPFPT